MRKPDSLSLQETLRAAVPRPSVDGLAKADWPTTQTIGAASTVTSNLRRKSTLLKSSYAEPVRLEEEETDEEEVDSCLDLALGGIELDEDDFAQDVPNGVSHTKNLQTRTAQRSTPPRSVKVVKASSSSRPSFRASPRKKPALSPRRATQAPKEYTGATSTMGLAVSRDALAEIKDNMERVSSKARTSRKPSLVPKDVTGVTARRRTTSTSKVQ